MFGRPAGPGEGVNMSVMTADFWSTRRAMRNDVARPTIYDPPHQMLKKTRYLPLLVRTGTPTINTTL
jgi:hypothetical protein